VEAVAVLKEPCGRFSQSSDGVNLYEAIEGMSATERVRIALPAKGHWYDARAHRYLGEIGEIRTTLKEAEPALYAMLPYQVRGLTLSVSSGRSRGEKARYEARVSAGGGRPVRHVLKIEVSGPDGRKRPLYSGNIDAKAGIGTGSFTLALNDQKGRWRMAATDVFSGATAEKSWTVR
jgi:hypothetical protein